MTLWPPLFSITLLAYGQMLIYAAYLSGGSPNIPDFRDRNRRSVLKGSHAAVCRKMINLFLNDSCLDRPDVASIFVRFPPELMDRKCASLTFSGQTDLSLSIQAMTVTLKYALGKEKQGG